jgi:hypothetical protein
MNNDYRDVCIAAKHALMELTMLECYDVSDPVGVATFIEEMSDKDVLLLTEEMIVANDPLAGQILRETYNKHLSSKKPNLIVDQYIWSQKRNSVLIQEDKKEDESISLSAKQIIAFIMAGSLPSALAILATKSPRQQARILAYVRRFITERFGSTKAFIEKFPITRKFYQAAKNKISAATKKSEVTVINAAGQPVKQMMTPGSARAWKVAQKIEDLPKRIGSAIKRPRNALIAGGLLAAALSATYIYQRFMSPAAKSCHKYAGREKSKCILKFKISAATKAIAGLEDSLSACDSKPDPQKCRYSIQKKIWYWKMKKQKYEDKLERYSKKVPANSVYRSRETAL